MDDYGTLSGHGRGFRARDGEIEDLKRRIGDTIMQLKQDTQHIQSMGAQIGTRSDSDALRERIHGTSKNCLAKVERCRSLFTELTLLSKESSDRAIQLTVKSLQQNLTGAAESFQRVSSEVLEGMRSTSVPRQQLDMSDGVDVEEDSDKVTLIRNSGGHSAQKQSFVVSNEVAHIEERARKMESLEGDIRQLNEVMLDIGKLVVTQGEVVDTIEQNVEHVTINVDEGNRQLEKGVMYKKCSRRLQCTIAIIIFVVLVVIIIVAVTAGCIVSKKC